MWLSVFFVSAVIVNYQPTLGTLPQKWPIALIHHEGAALEYFEATRSHPDRKSLTRYKNLDKEGRKEACLKYLANATASFSNPEDTTQYAEEAFEDYVEQTFQAHDNLIIENFTFETSGGQLETQAHMCIAKADSDSWAISPGFHDGVFFAFRKTASEEKFQLFGLLEEVAHITAYNLDLQKRQNLYLKGKREQSADTKTDDKEEARSLCSLSINERFRLCAVAKLAQRYGILQRFKKEAYFISQDIPEEKLCIKSNVMIIESKKVKKNIPADFVSCAFNTDGEHPDFFLTLDFNALDSAFIADAMWMVGHPNHAIYDEMKGFKLAEHLTNIRVLKSFAEDQ